MDTQEMFRIFDACRPSVAQVKEYLERISGVSPFDLIFINGEHNSITKNIEANAGELLGIVIDKTIFYVKCFEREENPNLQQISAKDIFAFGKTLHPRAAPMNIKHLSILGKNQKKYENLCDMLEVFGYKAPPLQKGYLLFPEDNLLTHADYYDVNGTEDGNMNISHFLEYYGNIFYCVDWQ